MPSFQTPQLAAIIVVGACTAAHSAGNPESSNWHLQGDAASVRNDDGALVASYPAGRTAESFAQLAGRTPIIWARYNPGEAIGHILVTTSTRLPNGTTQVRLVPFRPTDGSRFATGGAGKRITYFSGVNPFQQFNAGDDYFRGVNFTAFLAATGLVMRSTNASVAFVYYPSLTPTQRVRATGSVTSWRVDGTASFTAQGRWLLGLQGEAGDRRGFVPAYRIMNCDPAIDTRNGCVVKGFASFVPWDFGNLPATSVTLADRASNTVPDLGTVGAAFTGLEGYMRDASLWQDAAWSTISGTTASNALQSPQAAKIAEGELGRRDRLAELTATGINALDATLTYGMVAPGATSLWNPSDLATAQFITPALTQVAGGLGATSSSADWQSGRDAAQAQDVRTHRGTTATTRVINDVR